MPSGRAEPIDLLVDHLLQGLRHAVLGVFEHAERSVLARGFRGFTQRPASAEIGHRMDHEQGIAFGAPAHPLREPLERHGGRDAGTPGGQIVGHRRFAEGAQRQLRTLPVHLQFLLEPFQRMPPHDQLHRPIGADHQQARRLPPPRQGGEQVQGGIIAPVQVLQHQHQGGLRGHRFQRLRHLPQHPLRRCRHPLALQLGLLGRAEQPGQLPEPGRGIAAQQRDESFALRGPAEPAQRFQHRQVSFPGAVMLHALP